MVLKTISPGCWVWGSLMLFFCFVFVLTYSALINYIYSNTESKTQESFVVQTWGQMHFRSFLKEFHLKISVEKYMDVI